MPIDGVDFAVNEPQPFSKKWYLHKFKSAGLRYEIGVSIATGNILWASRPFYCGSHTDLCIFRQDIQPRLVEHERFDCDQRYQDDVCLNQGDIPPQSRHGFAWQRAEHECLNSRMNFLLF